MNLRRKPPPEERGDLSEDDEDDDNNNKKKKKEEEDDEEAVSSDDSDSTYFGAKEEDVSLGSSFEEEDVEEDKKPKVKTPNKKTPKKSDTPKKSKTEEEEVKEAIKMAKNDGDTKYIYKLADGRLCCVFQLPSGFEGTFEFGKGSVKKKVLLKRVMPRWAYNAQRVFRRKGFGPNDANVVELQTLMDKQRDKDVKAMGMDPESYNGPIYTWREVFNVEDIGVKEVLPYFLDEYGSRTADINADTGSGAEWVFFWLRDKASVKEIQSVGRIVRNRTRGRDSMESEDGDENNRPRGRSSSEFHDAQSTVSV